MIYEIGDKYEGEWKDGKRNGQGTMIYEDGDQYEGEWNDGKLHGQGTYLYKDGDKHVGEYKDGGRNGQGTLTWSDGNKYVGEFKDGVMSGQGTYTWPDGRKYVGEWKDGVMNGQGTYTWPDGRKYVGEWKDDKYDGQGTYTWPDGRKYVGDYKDGNEWNGTYYDKQGKATTVQQEGEKLDEKEFSKQSFFSDNKLTLLPNGNFRDENFEEYELEEERGDFIVYKPEGMRGKRAYIKTDGEKNYLAWSGPISIEDKSKFLRGDLEKSKEESQPKEEVPVQEQEVENIEVKQENESETSDATMSISERLNNLTKLYDEGILTKEELQKKTAELMS
jgi:hypothetical protein